MDTRARTREPKMHRAARLAFIPWLVALALAVLSTVVGRRDGAFSGRVGVLVLVTLGAALAGLALALAAADLDRPRTPRVARTFLLNGLEIAVVVAGVLWLPSRVWILALLAFGALLVAVRAWFTFTNLGRALLGPTSPPLFGTRRAVLGVVLFIPLMVLMVGLATIPGEDIEDLPQATIGQGWSLLGRYVDSGSVDGGNPVTTESWYGASHVLPSGTTRINITIDGGPATLDSATFHLERQVTGGSWQDLGRLDDGASIDATNWAGQAVRVRADPPTVGTAQFEITIEALRAPQPQA